MERLPLPRRLLHPIGYPNVGHLPVEKQEGLRAFWLDGLFSSLADGFAVSYYALYMLSLGASNAQIGLANSLTQIAAASMAIPGAVLAERTGRYRGLSTRTGIVMRAMWLVMIAAPWLLNDAGAVWMVLVAWVLMTAAGNAGAAAWMALQADLVPTRLRGAYLASRNVIMQVMRLGSVPLAGLLVGWIGEPAGYQVSLGCAYAIGLISLYYYVRVPEHPHDTSEAEDRFTLLDALRAARKMPMLLRFMASTAVLQFGVMFLAPFVNVYLVDEVELSVPVIGFTSTVSTLAAIVGMRLLGRYLDLRGNKWTMRFSLAMPLLPVMWLFVQNAWQAYLVSGFAALSWTGFNLGSFNMLLMLTPNQHRPRFVALHTTTIALVSAISPLIAGYWIDAAGFEPVFITSTVVRYIGLGLFFWLVHEPQSPPDVPSSGGVLPEGGEAEPA